MNSWQAPIGDNRRLMKKYTQTPIYIDPLDLVIARHEAKLAEARAQIAKGYTPQASAQELRGIPVQGKGVCGVSPGSNPWAELMAKQPREDA